MNMGSNKTQPNWIIGKGTSLSFKDGTIRLIYEVLNMKINEKSIGYVVNQVQPVLMMLQAQDSPK